MSAAYSEHISAFISEAASGLIASYCMIAVGALVIYDHLCTVSREVEFIWSRGFNFATIMFHLNRWTLLLWAVSSITLAMSPLPTISICKGLNYWPEIIQIILFILWAVFSSTRIYMMSQGSSLLALAGLVLNLVPVGVNTCLWFAYTFYVLAPAFQGGLECATGYQNLSLATNSKLAISTRTCVIAADILVLITTWYKTYSIKRDLTRAGIPSPLITLLLRDGTFYFIILLVLNVLQMLGIMTNIFVYASVFTIPLSSVIVTHFLLNLREVTHKQTDDYSRESRDDPQATLRFASVIGSIGGNLDFDFEPFDNVEDVDDSSGCLKSELNSSAETKFSADSLGVAGHAMNVC